MSVLNLIQEQKLDMLNGCEVRSLKHEGVVSIRGNKVIMDGEVIEFVDEPKKLNYLWKLYVKSELR